MRAAARAASAAGQMGSVRRRIVLPLCRNPSGVQGKRAGPTNFKSLAFAFAYQLHVEHHSTSVVSRLIERTNSGKRWREQKKTETVGESGHRLRLDDKKS